MRFAGAACVLDDNAHAVAAIIVVEIAHDPGARMIHFDDCRDALCCADPQDRNLCWIRHQIAVQRNDLKGVPRQNAERSRQKRRPATAAGTIDFWRLLLVISPERFLTATRLDTKLRIRAVDVPTGARIHSSATSEVPMRL